MDRQRLGRFLITAREGMASTGPGVKVRLHSDEVARRIGMSLEHYDRLERGEGTRPSRKTVVALAEVLRLRAGRRHLLFQLCGYPPSRWTAADYARAGVDGAFRVVLWLVEAAVGALG